VQPRSQVARREELLREHVLALLSREAVAISIEEAQARGKPWPGDHEQVEPELPEPEVPLQAGEADLA
jgi:hypothetical protein